MFATIGVIAVVLLAAVLALAATKPDSFRVERATRIEGKRPSNRMVDRVQWLSGVTSIGWWPLRWG